MNSIHPSTLQWSCGALFTAVLAVAPAAHVRAIEVHEIDAQRLADRVGDRITIDGRFQSATGDRLRLVGSPIDFRLAAVANPLRPGVEHLQVIGTVTRAATGILVEVDYWEPLPTEADQADEQRKRIAEGDFERLYELSRWTRSRADWYDDRQLLRRSTSMYREAFAWEEEAIAGRRDGAGMLELAARGERLGLEVDEVERIAHRGLWLQAKSLPEGDQAAWQALADRVADRLRGTDTRHPAADDPRAFDDELAAYLADPVARHAGAPVDERPHLHRLLWVWLTSRAIDVAAQAPGADLAELAEQARRRVPERPGLAERLELAELDRQSARPGELSRGKMIELRAGYQRHGQAAAAERLAAAWLAAERTRVPDDDVEAMVRLARDYLELADDRQAAVELYLAAVRVAPDMAEAVRALEQQGYRRIEGTWRPDDAGRAPIAGRSAIASGDSEQDVLRRHGPPDAVTRTLTRNWITEQWIYRGPPAVYIYMRRSTATGRASVRSVRAP